MPTSKKKRQQRAANSAKSKQVKARFGSKESRANRPTVYPEPHCLFMEGDQCLTSDQAKELLGWQQEDDKNPFGANYLFKHEGVKIRCSNNISNRPIYMPNIAKLKQEMLRNRWVLNGEPVILDTTGMILNGQHTLIALVFATAEYEKHPDRYPELDGPPKIDKLLVTGIDGSDHVVNTMDTCKPRSLMDVVYRAHYFDKLPSSAQRQAAKMTEHAIRLLWQRTGTHSSPFSVKQTHSESIDFLERHLRLLECVSHIYHEDDATKKIGKYLSTGYASAVLFLMATSTSSSEEYYGQDTPSEKSLDFARWDKACEFFVLLASGSKELAPVVNAIAQLTEEGSTSPMERLAVVIKAWNCFVEGTPITPARIKLKFEVTETDRHLAETPLIGGIDVGEDGLDVATKEDPTPEEIEAAKNKVRRKNNRNKAESKGSTSRKATRKGESWAKGDRAWVISPGDDTYFAEVIGDPYDCADGVTRVMVENADGQWEEDVQYLSLTEYIDK